MVVTHLMPSGLIKNINQLIELSFKGLIPKNLDTQGPRYSVGLYIWTQNCPVTNIISAVGDH